MKKAYFNLFFIIIYVFSSHLFAAKEVIYCSHSEICSLASKILNENLVELRSEIVIVGDPHDFVPKSDSIKKLMDAKILLSGPNELNPWMKKINEQRNKTSEKKTLHLLVETKFKTIYPQASGEALAHFWLYPSIYCSQLNQLYKEIEKNHLSSMLKNNSLSIEKCAEQAAQLDKEFAEALLKLKYPIILTHDALYAYILKVNPDPFKVLAIKGSGHHEEASPQTIKKLYQMLKNKKVVWLEEKGIHVPENVMNKKRKEDVVIFLDTAQSKNNANDHVVSYTLKEFIQKLNEIKP